MENDERELVAAAQADPARFVDLYDLYFPRVWAFAIRRLNRAEAEDLTSDVFRKAMEALPGYEWRGSPFASWLLRIAANSLTQRWEKRRRESPDPLPETAEPDAGLERRAILYQLLDRLPPSQREFLELRYVEGLSLAEAGERMGKSEGAAKQMHRRALEQLRAQMLEPQRSGKERADA